MASASDAKRQEEVNRAHLRPGLRGGKRLPVLLRAQDCPTQSCRQRRIAPLNPVASAQSSRASSSSGQSRRSLPPPSFDQLAQDIEAA